MPDWLQQSYMQHALFAGIIVSVLASYSGVFVVQRGLSFLGSGLAHAAFGGVAFGLLLESRTINILPTWVDPLWVALPFTVLIAIAITWVQDRTAIGGDTSIGIFFSLSVALGVIFISLRDTYTADPMSYLFGNITLVAKSDLWIALGLLGVCLLLSPFWPRWAYATFDRELAQADRLAVSRDDYILNILIAVIVVVAVKLVGIIMIAAFLVIPPATARLFAHTFIGMTWMAILVSILSTLAGLRISYFQNLPSGATIIMLQAGMFFVSIGLVALRRRGRAKLAGRL